MELMANGVPELPESRSTKDELWKEIKELRLMLSDVRFTLLLAYADGVIAKADGSVDNPASRELGEKVFESLKV